ncbi:MAG: cadmium-translocating P-type ATPase, partial [Clostridiales bacterium]|nr:cadmium-translocating P-type ATPase [Clostridiales bacterium]
PPIILSQNFLIWIERALTFLVISCPCALVISVPLSFFGGIGGASKVGVLVKGSNFLESLSKANTVVFDKTGTLTKGNFAVNKIVPQNISKNELLEFAAYAENYSSHPIALSIKNKYSKEIDDTKISDLKEIAGHGISALIKGKQVLVGNERLMRKFSISFNTPNQEVGTIIYVAIDNRFSGYILISDEIKSDSKQAISELKKLGIDKTIMLTGDSDLVGREVVKQLGIDKAYTELLPVQKVEIIEKLLSDTDGNSTIAFVGDGINDAPALARADIGIAMGGMGSDAAIEAADIVIMTDEPSKIGTVIKISKKTLRIVKQNIIFALGVKFIVLVLGAFGYASMWAAVFADVGVSIIAILNAIRALNVKKIK